MRELVSGSPNSSDVWRLISGIGLGLEIVTIGAYLSEMAPKGMRGQAFACSQAIGFCSVPVISFLAYVLVPAAPLGVAAVRGPIRGAHKPHSAGQHSRCNAK